MITITRNDETKRTEIKLDNEQTDLLQKADAINMQAKLMLDQAMAEGGIRLVEVVDANGKIRQSGGTLDALLRK